MAVIKASELVAYTDKAVAEKWKYIWGANGTDVNKDGEEDADCSGLIVGAMRSKNPKYGDRRADAFFAQCIKTGPISTIPSIPGVLLHKKGHIGVSRGDGTGNEASSSKGYAVRTKIKDRPWTDWGMHPDIDYSEYDREIVMTRTLKFNMSGADVLALELRLGELGYDCKINAKERRTGIGHWGFGCSAAFKAWQKAHPECGKLVNGKWVPDGHCGPKSAAALGFVWAGK
jgi:hypothetical protein